jgi:ankyrin repeat protein
VVELLLDKGADVNAQGGGYGNALEAASDSGHEKVVELLLAKGADVNAQGGYYGNALQAASYSSGHEKVVELLLAKGADVNAQGGRYGNALQVASYGGHETVVELLLKEGADVNAQGGYFGNALHIKQGEFTKAQENTLENTSTDATTGSAPSRATTSSLASLYGENKSRIGSRERQSKHTCSSECSLQFPVTRTPKIRQVI